MIVDFSVKNFKSIREEQTLSMVAANRKDGKEENVIIPGKGENISLLKSAVIYGANASGKTNLVEALEAFHLFVLNSTDLKLEQGIPIYKPYKLDKSSRDALVGFSLEFFARDKTRYSYSISFNHKEVLFEELVFYPKKQESRLFLREKGKEIKFGPYFKGRKRSIEAELLANNLFLSKAANSNHEQMKEIYLFFLESLRFYTLRISQKRFFPDMIFELRRSNNAGFKSKLIDFLMAADTGIHSVGVEKEEHDQAQLFLFPPEEMDVSDYNPVTYHKTFDGDYEIGTVSFDLAEESNGTIKMFQLAGKIIKVLENGGTLIVDELDSSIHPLMSEFIIELFHDPERNPNNAQIIFTTHDTSLLNAKLFRRDQIWFTAKDKYGATELFSLDEFDKNEVRKNIPFDKWYLDGRFGALPLLDRRLFKIEKVRSRG